MKKRKASIKSEMSKLNFVCSPKWYADFSQILEDHFKESTNEFKDKMEKASGINFDSIYKRTGK